MASGAGSEQSGMFTQVMRSATLSEKVVASITRAIVDGSLVPGQRLLSERELGEQFGVSRTVIREAVRSLVASGLVEARSGRGLQVAEAGPEAVSRAMSMFLQRSAVIDYPRVNEVRSALEIDMAGYAAERATPEDVARLRELTDELAAVRDGEVERAAQLDVAFHRTLAQATQNELFVVLLDAVGEVLLEIRRRSFASPGMRRYAVEAHTEILERIATGEPDEARDAMRRHLQASVEAWSGDDGTTADVPALKR